MMKRFVIFLAAMLLFGSLSYCQPEKELFNFRYNLAPINVNGNKDVVQLVDVNVRFPVMMKDRTTIGGGIGFETLFTGKYPLFGSDHVAGISTQWFLNRNFVPGKSLLMVASAGIYSDFKDVSGEDLRYSLGFRYKTRSSDTFMMSYGLGVSGQFFGVLIAPFVDFDWKINEKLKLSGPVPLNTRLRYTINSKAEIVVFLKPDNSTFRLSHESYQSQYFQKKQWNAGLGFEYLATKHWLVSIKGGYSLRRKFEIYDSSQNGVLSILTFDVRGNKRTPNFQHEERSLFLEFNVGWVLGNN